MYNLIIHFDVLSMNKFNDSFVYLTFLFCQAFCQVYKDTIITLNSNKYFYVSLMFKNALWFIHYAINSIIVFFYKVNLFTIFIVQNFNSRYYFRNFAYVSDNDSESKYISDIGSKNSDEIASISNNEQGIYSNNWSPLTTDKTSSTFSIERISNNWFVTFR